MLPIRTLWESICIHHIRDLGLLPEEVTEDIARQAALKRNTLIRLTPGVTSEPIPGRRTEPGTLEFVAELRMNDLGHIVFSLRIRGFIEETVNVTLLDLDVSVEIVCARPVTEAAYTQLRTVIAEVEPLPLRHGLTRIILSIRSLGAELKPEVVEIRMDVLQAVSNIRPLIVAVEAFSTEIEDMSLVILKHRFGKRLKIDYASRRRSPRTGFTTLRRASTLRHDTRTTRDANLFLLQCVRLSEFCERSLGVVWCTNRELADVLRFDLAVHLLIDRNRSVVRVPLDGILQLIRLRSRTLSSRLLGTEQRPPARVIQRRLVIRLTPVLLHLQPGKVVVHLRKQCVANCQLDVAVDANVRDDEVDT